MDTLGLEDPRNPAAGRHLPAVSSDACQAVSAPTAILFETGVEGLDLSRAHPLQHRSTIRRQLEVQELPAVHNGMARP